MMSGVEARRNRSLAPGTGERTSGWITRPQQRKPINVVRVALANKPARATCVALHRQ
jgi:hypothetical protein